MAIYIKGMEMPKNCLECKLAINDNNHQRYCPFTNVVCLNIGVQDNCPLVYIPEPHGRLIDADWFFNTFTELASYNTEANAPTVIEGSE